MSEAGNWCLIESDPGVFTQLIGELGAQDVQVEEVWSLDDSTLERLRPIFGLIFLFKWQGRDADSDIESDYQAETDEHVFFAKQVITNACATQAILSILLNCDDRIDIGEELRNFKAFTADFPPELKGLAISNSDMVRTAHNAFAQPDQFITESGGESQGSKEDVFHFIAYVPVRGALYELDGLREAPLNLGACTDEDWLEKVRPIIQSRIARYASSEIRFNLMAVIRNRMKEYEQRHEELLARLFSLPSEESEMSPEQTQVRLEIDAELEQINSKMLEERNKFKRYSRENSLRKHNFIPMILEVLKLLAKRDQLAPQIERAKTKAAELRDDMLDY
ncbi:uncharacterized protein VTP21DRAFT_1384 [Calcarisporiella thermophila]|uniref:uncharacterized protein n=1 Tax=Calcarisporiella thermophila TaxID=911321 RepID=UPI0037445998